MYEHMLDHTCQCVCGSHWPHGSSHSSEGAPGPRMHCMPVLKLECRIQERHKGTKRKDCLSPDRERDQCDVTQQAELGAQFQAQCCLCKMGDLLTWFLGPPRLA